jgi:hypothetical protein
MVSQLQLLSAQLDHLARRSQTAAATNPTNPDQLNDYADSDYFLTVNPASKRLAQCETGFFEI